MNRAVEQLFVSEENVAFLILTETNRFYLTGFRSDIGAVLLLKEKQYFLADSRYSEDAQSKCPDFEVIETKPSEFNNKVKEILKDAEIEVLYLENLNLRHQEYLSIVSDFSDFKVSNLDNRIELCRAVKTEEELQKIVRAQEIAEQAFEKLRSILKVGISERDFAIELEYNMLKLGAEAPSFPTIVAFDENSSKPHYSPSHEKKLKNNSVVLVDFGARVDGYCSDTTRTFCFGKPTEEFSKIYDVVLKALLNMEKFSKAGIQCNEADGFCREIIKANGYGENFLHSTGHGVGLEIHEFPSVGPNFKPELLKNMVVTCEPGIYIPGKFGIRIEDLLVIEENGVNVLTKLPKELN